MAFPTVAGTAVYTGVAATSHTVNLPASIASGNLLILIICNTASATVTTPTGWTALVQDLEVTGGMRQSVFYRHADGGEGTTLAVSFSASCICDSFSYRITGHAASTAPGGAVAKGGSTATSDPPNLDPGWGALDTLWIATTVHGEPLSGTPANYANALDNDGGSIRDRSARRELNAASENPGTFSHTGSWYWVATTVAVKPAAVATSSNLLLLGVS